MEKAYRATHTPGPWIAIPPRVGAAITIYAADGDTPIATTCSNTSPATMQMHRDGEVKANASLIAAAPDLLASLIACEAALRLVERETGKSYSATTNARADIARATEGD